MVAYNTSKAALDHMTRCVALETAGRGVRINAVNPGVIVTEVHKRSGMTDEQYTKVRRLLDVINEQCCFSAGLGASLM